MKEGLYFAVIKHLRQAVSGHGTRAYPPALVTNANAGFLKKPIHAASALWRQKVNPLRGFLFPDSLGCSATTRCGVQRKAEGENHA